MQPSVSNASGRVFGDPACPRFLKPSLVLPLTVLLVISGLLLRWVALGRLSVWGDEAFTWWVALQSPGRIIQIIQQDTWPPLYYLVMHFWIGLFGDSEFAMRSQAALASTIAMALGVALAWRMYPGRAGAFLLATGLLAVSVVQVEFARDVRCYATASMLVLATLWTLIRRVEGGRFWWMGAYAICGAALVYQHNVMWFYLMCLHVAWWVWPGPQRWTSRLKDMVVGNLLVLVLFAPWIPSLMGQMHRLNGGFWTERPTFNELSRVVNWQSGVHTDAIRDLAQDWSPNADSGDRLFRLPVFGLIVVAAGVAVWFTRRDDRRRVIALLAVGMGPILVVFIYSQVRQSIFIGRVFTPTSVVMPLVLAALLVPKMRWTAVLSGVLCLGAVGGCYAWFTHPRTEGWREAITQIQQVKQPGDRLVFFACEGRLVYDYYVKRLALDPLPVSGVPADFFANDPPRVQLHVKSDADLVPMRTMLGDMEIRRVLLVGSHIGWLDPTGRVEKYFDSHWIRQNRLQLRGVSVTQYQRPGIVASPASGQSKE